MPDLKTAKADCETAEAFLKRFGVPNYRGKDGNDDFNLTNDPKLRDVNQAKRKLLQFINLERARTEVLKHWWNPKTKAANWEEANRPQTHRAGCPKRRGYVQIISKPNILQRRDDAPR